MKKKAKRKETKFASNMGDNNQEPSIIWKWWLKQKLKQKWRRKKQAGNKIMCIMLKVKIKLAGVVALPIDRNNMPESYVLNY